MQRAVVQILQVMATEASEGPALELSHQGHPELLPASVPSDEGCVIIT